MADKKSLNMQDVPNDFYSPKKSQKIAIRIKIFKLAMNLIDALWKVFQIVRHLIEIFGG